MKKKLRAAAAVVALLPVFMSCYPTRIPVSSSGADNNQTYKVDFLFEHEGCKVYRFYDMGKYVYFINSTGNVAAEYEVKKDSIETETIYIRSITLEE
jgi:hypothetical protein